MAVAAAAVTVFVFKDQIKETFESENSSLLRRCDAVVGNLEKGLAELDKQEVGNTTVPLDVSKKVLTHAQLDLDFVTQTLDEMKFSTIEDAAGNLRKARKGLIDRLNVLSEDLERLQKKSFFKTS